MNDDNAASVARSVALGYYAHATEDHMIALASSADNWLRIHAGGAVTKSDPCDVPAISEAVGYGAQAQSVLEQVRPILRAIAEINTPEGRERFVMMGPRAMAGVAQLYAALPEDTRTYIENE